MPEARQRVTGMRLLVGVLLAGLVAVIIFQWRGGTETNDYTGVRGAELVELLKSLDAANERLASQVDELSRQRDELQSSTTSDTEARLAAQERAAALAVLAGTVGAEGPGITLVIEADPGAVTASVLLNAVNELRDAGAEAIAINERVRVVAQTYFLDDEDGIRVAGRLVQAPFTIDVIGSSRTLAEAVRFRGGLIDQVRNRGGVVEVIERERLEITSVVEPMDPQQARRATD